MTGQAGGGGLKVAFVVAVTTGGTGRHVAMLADGCAARGAAVAVFGPASTQQRFFRSRTFVPVEITDRPRPARDAAAAARLRRLLARSAPDVVHAHGLRPARSPRWRWQAPPAAAARCSSPCTTRHPQRAFASAVYRVLERIVARRADAVASVSADLAARMRRRGARDGGRALVPAPRAGAPSADEVAKVRREFGGPGRPVILAAGRLAAQKGFGTLLAAAARWQRRDPVPLLVIAGEGPLEDVLRGHARSAGLAVRFLGQRGDIPALLAVADVIVLASTWEGQPSSSRRRCGRAAARRDAGGRRPRADREDGALLVPPGDADGLASAVLSVLDDPERGEKLSAAALARAAALPDEAAAIDAALASITDRGHRRTGR